MEINIIENKKNRLVFEIKGEGNTLCNIMTKELWEDNAVKTSGYHIDHPLVGIPKVIIETTSKDAKTVLLDGAKRLKSKIKKMADEVDKIK